LRHALDGLVFGNRPDAVRELKSKAFRNMLIGSGSMGAGIVLTYLGYRAAGLGNNGGQYRILYGLILFGLGVLVKGVADYRRAQTVGQPLDHQTAKYFKESYSFVGGSLAIFSAVLFWAPIVGLIVSILAVIMNQRVHGWARTTSWIASCLSLVVTIAIVVLCMMKTG